MALFEFECQECGATFERLALGGKGSDDVKPSWCPKCELYDGPFRLKLGPSSFKLCGAGFHTNDYPKTSTLGNAKKSFAVGAAEGGKK